MAFLLSMKKNLDGKCEFCYNEVTLNLGVLMTIYHYIGITLFILFCAAMIWQIHSDMVGVGHDIARGYGIANITHSAQVFEKTGVDLLGDIDYIPVTKQDKKKTKQKSQDSFSFEL